MTSALFSPIKLADLQLANRIAVSPMCQYSANDGVAPLVIPDLLTLETLADVRALVEKHLPAEYRAKFTWRQFAGLLKRAAEGQQAVAEVSIALRIVLQLEGIPCR
jgi:NADH:flavin oxidoreductase / NADH oxidase family